jgi:hypothetical protein
MSTTTTATADTHRMVRGDGPFDMKAKCVRCGLGRGAKVHKVPATVETPEEHDKAAKESPADAREARAAELAEAVAAGDVSFDAAAAELLGGAAPVTAPLAVVTLDGQETAVEVTATPAAKPAKAGDATVAYRIGKVLREWILANDADSDLAAHIASRNVCYDGTATVRVTAKWAQELSWLATDLENAAVKGDARIAATAKAPSIMAARAARKTLSNLF